MFVKKKEWRETTEIRWDVEVIGYFFFFVFLFFSKMVFSGQREIRNFWGFSSLDKDRKENRKAIENIHTTKTWSLIKTTTNNASTSLCTHSKDWRHDYFFLICLFVPPFRLLSSSSSLSTCKKDFKRFGVGSGRESKNKNDHRVGPVPKLHCDESRAIVKRRLCQSKKKKILRIVKLTFVFVLKLPPHECECVVSVCVCEKCVIAILALDLFLEEKRRKKPSLEIQTGG